MLLMIADYVYKHFLPNHVAMCEGNSINASVIGISIQECQKRCDMNRTCLSFSYCGNGNGTCDLKDKILHGFEQKVYKHNCTSYYKKCSGNLYYSMNMRFLAMR